jgi:hypothetical protein
LPKLLSVIPVSGFSVAGNVEGVEGVKAETHRLLTNYMKVLERGHVDVEVSGPACVAIARRSKGIRRLIER